MGATEFLAGLKIPDFEVDYEDVALSHPDEYPICEGRLVSNKGLDISIDEFENNFEEIQVKHSTSLQSRIKARSNYLVGPLARFNLQYEKLPESPSGRPKSRGLNRGATTLSNRSWSGR
jgi:hypothetical protein